jgi:4'-phosphopantetheinyl transferase EntD
MLRCDSTVTTIGLFREDWSGTAYFSWARSVDYPRLDQSYTVFLDPDECHRYESMKFERRRTTFLLGRYAAKQALSAYFDEPDLSRIAIRSGVFGQPIVQYLCPSNANITISHTPEKACAIACPDVHPMGLDIESIDGTKSEVIKSQMTSSELRFLVGIKLNETAGLTLLWSAKEALSKILMCGLTCPFELLAIRSLRTLRNWYEGEFLNFPQYRFQSWVTETVVYTIVFPGRTQIETEMDLFLAELPIAHECSNQINQN